MQDFDPACNFKQVIFLYGDVHPKSLLETMRKSCDLTQHNYRDNLVIRNPNRVKTKGRPKTGSKRYVSQTEKQRSKRKKTKFEVVLVKFSPGSYYGFNICYC